MSSDDEEPQHFDPHEEADENVEEHHEEDDGAEEEQPKAAESDDEEFEGFGEEEIESAQKTGKRSKVLSDDEDGKNEEGNGEADEEQAHAEEDNSFEDNEAPNVDEEGQEEQLGDIEPEPEQEPEPEPEYEQKKKKKRRGKNGDSELLIDDNLIINFITEMKNAAAEDRAANEKAVCSLKKLKMLPQVMNLLQKTSLHASMIELGILGAIAEWFAPLPDRSLPNVKIREELIGALQEFGEIGVDYLKSSGIGKAVMFSYKHPRETKSNKEKLEKLINHWSRPIFSLDANFKALSKEERQKRDEQHVKTVAKRRSSIERTDNDSMLADSLMSDKPSKKSKSSKSNGEMDANPKALRPGDPGFVPRARVPIPSAKDYVVRPKSNVDSLEMGYNQSKKPKKTESRFDKHMKRMVDNKKHSKAGKAVSLSVEGRKMPL